MSVAYVAAYSTSGSGGGGGGGSGAAPGRSPATRACASTSGERTPPTSRPSGLHLQRHQRPAVDRRRGGQHPASTGQVPRRSGAARPTAPPWTCTPATAPARRSSRHNRTESSSIRSPVHASTTPLLGAPGPSADLGLRGHFQPEQSQNCLSRTGNSAPVPAHERENAASLGTRGYPLTRAARAKRSPISPGQAVELRPAAVGLVLLGVEQADPQPRRPGILHLLLSPLAPSSPLVARDELRALSNGGSLVLAPPRAGQTAAAKPPTMAASGWAMTLSQSCTTG